MIAKFIGWLILVIIGIALVIVLLPLILIVIIIALIVGLLSGANFKVWTSRAQAGAQAGANTVKSKINEHAPGSVKSTKPGQRKATIVDADSRDI